jgi:uncharacterized membrane protein YdjX (TVP38/TMEM64 family)
LKIPRRHWVWVATGAAVLVCGALAVVLPLRDWSAALEDRLLRMDFYQGLAAYCAFYLVGSLLMIPAWIFAIVGGAVFGMAWGLLGAAAASTLAALAAFLIARYVLRERFEDAARRNEAFAAVDKAVRREPWKMVALLRMSPVLPSGLKSYFLGLTRVGPVPYTLASAAGMFPGLALKVWIGHVGRDVLAGGGALNWALLGSGIAATVIMALLVGRIARKRLGMGRGA